MELLNTPFVFVLVILTVAAFYDAGREKIPNGIILAGAISGCLALGFSFPARFFLGLIFLFPLFHFRAFGGGDVKLLALMAGWLGWHCFLTEFFFGLLFAAVPAFCLLIRKKHEKIPMAPFFMAGHLLSGILGIS